ncbi:ead/Ea22-like family protein [Citrobacter braakii]|uniref:ead/Ea22-like family protein n=1 Tax=Citrobacter braakii TaxID=57706 RepID=UPI0019055BAD|nr:ead/Ea22-like family protein [Citrobacter braakii]MBJ9570249.1 ead/Ea22-like family protein [Citrobacter braakii]
MTALNKQALRSKARSASAGEWIKESGDGWEAICSSDDQANAGFIIAHFEGPDAKANREFSQAANPDTVLALLDELEAVQKTSAARLEAIDRTHKMFQRERDRADAAVKRIAELEAREVEFPKPHANLIWIQAGHAPDDFWDDVAVSHSEKDRCCDGSERYPVYAKWEIEEMLAAAGIGVKGE